MLTIKFLADNVKKIVEKSIKTAIELFPSTYAQRSRYRTFHFCFVYRRNTLLTIGINNPEKENAKAKKFAERFGTEVQKNYRYVHSEVDAVSRLWSRVYIDNSLTFIVLRLNKNLDLKNSRPCPSCTKILRALDVTKVYWSDKNSDIQYGIKD